MPIRLSIWVLVALSAIERAWLLLRFGFTHIGIDDALIQQVAIDYGNGIFREPFLYGQNYNPMLEALLAAPFVRLGAAPWIALPLITSLLALIPFWSWALWAQRRGEATAALVLAAAPLLLPVEWGLLTSMPRGWMHGLALLAFIPWMHDTNNAWLRHALIAITLAAALLCNPNASPLVAACALWLLLRDGRRASLWVMGAAALAIAWTLQGAAQGWYAARPGSVAHPLLPSDLAFDPELLASGIGRINEHLLHMHPFGGMGLLSLALLLAVAVWLARKSEWRFVLAIATALVVMLLALGIPKAHEGCASVFFPLSRMMLGLPLLMAATLAWALRGARVASWMTWMVPLVLAITCAVGGMRVDGAVQRELAMQGCAWVREEPIDVVRGRCEAIAEAARASGCDLIVPIRWPHLRVDHGAHFAAHLTCYACPQLVPVFPSSYGAGYDRRTWVRAAHALPPLGRVLFIGGDPLAWNAAIAEGRMIEDVSDQGILMHIARCDSITADDFILHLGVDDDLAR